MVSLLLKLGKSNLNATDNENRTPLHLAAWQGHSVIVRLLIEHGASVNHACNQGATALGKLFYCQVNARFSITQILLLCYHDNIFVKPNIF